MRHLQILGGRVIHRLPPDGHEDRAARKVGATALKTMAPLHLHVGRLLDGTGIAKRDMSISVEGRNITTVRRSDSQISSDHDIHLPGMTLVPGLIDAHVHLNMEGDGRSIEDALDTTDGQLVLRSFSSAMKYLETGVTTVLDLGARDRTTLDLRDAIETGVVDGPRILSAGCPITRTGGHMWMMHGEADGADGVRKAVREHSKDRVDAIKLVASGGATRGLSWFEPSFTSAELNTVVDEAHSLGLPVAAHCTGNLGLERSVRAGVDILVHSFFYEPDGSYRFRPDLAERIAQSGAAVNPTLYTIASRIEALRLVAQKRSLTTEEQRRLDVDLRGQDNRRDMAARLHKLGVPLIAGTDGGFSAVKHGRTVNELRELVEVGLNPNEAIQSATSTSARVLGMSTSLGVVRVGATADLLIVRGDPDSNIEALNDVVAVFQGGNLTYIDAEAPTELARLKFPV